MWLDAQTRHFIDSALRDGGCSVTVTGDIAPALTTAVVVKPVRICGFTTRSAAMLMVNFAIPPKLSSRNVQNALPLHGEDDIQTKQICSCHETIPDRTALVIMAQSIEGDLCTSTGRMFTMQLHLSGAADGETDLSVGGGAAEAASTCAISGAAAPSFNAARALLMTPGATDFFLICGFSISADRTECCSTPDSFHVDLCYGKGKPLGGVLPRGCLLPEQPAELLKVHAHA